MLLPCIKGQFTLTDPFFLCAVACTLVPVWRIFANVNKEPRGNTTPCTRTPLELEAESVGGV